MVWPWTIRGSTTPATLLGPRCPLPLDAPFTRAQAHDSGVSRRAFERMVRTGMIRSELHGVYAVTQAPNDPLMRATALGLVLPPDAVVVDRTAAWLHGLDALRRSAFYEAPPLDVVHVTDTRMNRPDVDGRRRGLIPSDITTVHGIPVTTGLRTALDCGRLLWRFDGLAVIDGFLRLGVPHDLMRLELGRFKGFRGVIQCRYLVSIGDGRAESGPESALRLHWYDAGLGRPELQWWVYSDTGVPLFRIDIADPAVRYGAEYDGEEFHTRGRRREARRGATRMAREGTRLEDRRVPQGSRVHPPTPRAGSAAGRPREGTSEHQPLDEHSAYTKAPLSVIRRTPTPRSPACGVQESPGRRELRGGRRRRRRGTRWCSRR